MEKLLPAGLLPKPERHRADVLPIKRLSARRDPI
jgi:hypothetical protein